MKDRTKPIHLHLVVGALPPHPCGIGEYTRHLLVHLRPYDHLGLTVWTLDGSDSLDADATFVHKWTVGQFLRVGWRMPRGAVTLFQYPSLAFLRSPGAIAMVVLLRLRRIRVVTMLHEYAASTLLGKVLIFATVFGSNEIVVSNYRDRKYLPRLLRNKTLIIPIGSNISRALNEPGGPRLPSHLIWAASFGLLLPSKRLEILLEVARKGIDGVGFVFIGKVVEGNEYSEQMGRQLRSLSREMQGSVVFVENASEAEVSRYLSVSSIYVNPDASPLTAKSGTALAACLHGLVPIGTAATDTRESAPFVHNENSLLFRELDVDTLREAIQGLAGDAPRRGQLQSAARSATAAHTWESIAARFVGLIDEHR